MPSSHNAAQARRRWISVPSNYFVDNSTRELFTISSHLDRENYFGAYENPNYMRIYVPESFFPENNIEPTCLLSVISWSRCQYGYVYNPASCLQREDILSLGLVNKEMSRFVTSFWVSRRSLKQLRNDEIRWLKRQKKRRANISSVMRLNYGVSSPAIYLGGVQDLLNLRLVNRDSSTYFRESLLTDMIGRNWTKMLQHLTPVPVDRRMLPHNYSSRRGFPIDPEEFSHLLKSHDCIVAGPFALQCVTGDKCGGGSIQGEMHLYCTTSGFRAMATYFRRHGYVEDIVHEYPSQQCKMLTLARLEHEVVLIRFCGKHSPRDGLAQFEGDPGVMTFHEGASVNYWFRDNHAKSRIVFLSKTVAPLCYAIIRLVIFIAVLS